MAVKKKILVVEGDRSIQQIVVKILQGEGFSVCPAGNGKEDYI